MSKLTAEELVNLKLLLSIDGFGPARIRNLLARFHSTEKILTADIKSLASVDGISKILAEKLYRCSSQKGEMQRRVEKELRVLQNLNGYIVSIWDDGYPQLLKKIYDPPLLLYFKGNFIEQDNFSIAIVGTRIPTHYGKVHAEKIAKEFAAQNITIVSGLARGIDSVAHSTAVKYGGRTIAVVGSGLDVIYPPENKKLFEDIASNGLIISEYSPGTQPDAQNFPKRNRIISGLSLGCLVIETALNGGAMQTASFALDQNREVFALPGNVGVRQSQGTNKLIRAGEAALIQTAEDILLDLKLKLKPVIGKNIPKPDAELNLFEEKIYNSLINEPQQIDLIAAKTALTTSECLVHLLSLEFQGLIKQLPGKCFMKI